MSRRHWAALGLGFLVTLGLFWLMEIMIFNPGESLKETRAVKMVEFIRLQREDQVVTRKRTLPNIIPPTQEPLPPTRSMGRGSPVKTVLPQADLPNLEIPDISARVGGSLIAGLQMGSGSNAGPGAEGISAGLVPIFRVPPQYPLRAERKRIEGWIRVEFTVDEQGHVVDPIVVESHPSRVFDRAAIKAVSKWKFKPKIIDGIAVKQRAVQLLEFRFNK